ncbi:MAG: hypothetical protein JEZ10_03675 [Verrucomicrobia bacterium]|nr:hypothetical protein [Verrucomicrobiota bacterium]
MKRILTTIIALVLTIGSAHAASGIFGTGVVLNNKGALTLYELTLTGDSRHTPVNSYPALNSIGWGTTALPSPNLGTFVQGTDKLAFKGGEILTWKNEGSDVTGANIYIKIDSGSFSPAYPLTFNEDNLDGKTGDQRWYTADSTVDLLSGLAAGTHTISVYIDAMSTDGTHVENNGGANFSATFTVVK